MRTLDIVEIEMVAGGVRASIGARPVTTSIHHAKAHRKVHHAKAKVVPGTTKVHTLETGEGSNPIEAEGGGGDGDGDGDGDGGEGGEGGEGGAGGAGGSSDGEPVGDTNGGSDQGGIGNGTSLYANAVSTGSMTGYIGDQKLDIYAQGYTEIDNNSNTTQTIVCPMHTNYGTLVEGILDEVGGAVAIVAVGAADGASLGTLTLPAGAAVVVGFGVMAKGAQEIRSARYSVCPTT